MPRSWLSICVGFAIIGLILGVKVASGADDSASGTLQIGAERFALKYVFAVMEADEPGSAKEQVTVFLSDVPVPEELRKATDDWVFWAGTRSRAGALHGVALSIDPATGVWSGGRLLTREGIESYFEHASPPESSSMRFTPAGPIGDRVEGKASRRKPLSRIEDAGAWLLEAEFRAAVVRRPAVSGVLTGTAALNSPQYKAVLAFVDACRKGNVDAIRNAVAPTSWEGLAGILASNKEEALKMFAQMAAETATLKPMKVTIRGDSADIELGDGKPGSKPKESQTVTLINGEWKSAN